MNSQNKLIAAKREQRDSLLGVQHQLAEMRPNLLAALPQTIPTDRFVRVAMTTVQLRPELLQCDRKSLLVAIQRCAADGLLPDGREATVVVFNEGDAGGKQAVYMPMYQGLLKKIRNSGELKSVSANVVYQADKFSYVQGDDEKIEHEPALQGNRGKPIGVYAIVKTKDGGIYRAYLTEEQVNERKTRSQTGRKDKGPWKTDRDEMWKKSAIRAVSKICPQSAELDRYLQVLPDTDDRAHQRIQGFAGGEMPDDDSLERTLFELKTSALSALSEATTRDECEHIWRTYTNECKKIDQDPDIEVESRKGDRVEALNQAAGQ